MVKSVAALAIFAVPGPSVIVLPGFAPEEEAGDPVALAKADWIEVRSLDRNWFKKVWPDFTLKCPRNGGSEP